MEKIEKYKFFSEIKYMLVFDFRFRLFSELNIVDFLVVRIVLFFSVLVVCVFGLGVESIVRERRVIFYYKCFFKKYFLELIYFFRKNFKKRV